jgi:parvulin-like peptidyl-prolyl isomerase
MQENSSQGNLFSSRHGYPQSEVTRSTGALHRLSIGLVITGILISGCATGNFRWYSPPGTESPDSATKYTGESEYADKYLLRSQLTDDNPALFKIDDSIQIRASDLMIRFESSHLVNDGGRLDWDEAADTLEVLLFETLVSLAADTFQLRQDSASWGDFSLVRDALLGKRFIEEAIYSQVTVDSLEVDSFYYSRPDIFTYNAQVDLGHIVLSKIGYRAQADSVEYLAIPNEELDSLIYRRLRFLKDAITDSLMFEEMADKYSLDRRTGDNGGRFGWVEQHNLHPEIETVLYDEDTPLHEVIGPVKSRDGVHLFYLYDRYRMGIPPLDKQRYQRAHGYVLGKYAKIYYSKIRDSLRVEYPTEFNDSVLAVPFRKADESAPVAWAPGVDTVRFVTYDRARSLLRTKIPFSQVLTTEQLRSIAQGIVDKRLTLMMARQLGIADNPDYKAEERFEYLSFARAAIYRQSRDLSYTPSEEEIQEYYQNHLSEYVVARPVRIQQIVFQDSVEAEFVRALAESGEDFLTLADTYYPGEVEIRRDAADLGYIGPEDFENNVYSVAKRSSPGEVPPPIKTRYGFHVVKVIDVKRQISVSEKKSEIVSELRRSHNEQVRANWVESLLGSHSITIEPVRYRGVVMGPRENRLYLSKDILPPELK